MAPGLGIVRPPEVRNTPELAIEDPGILDVDTSKILDPISNYIPLLADAKSKTSDLVCMELAAECDRLRVLIEKSETKKDRKPSDTAAIISKRITALKLYAQRLDDVEGKEHTRVELATVSLVVSLVRDVLKKVGVPQETREIVFQELIRQVSGDDRIVPRQISS